MSLRRLADIELPVHLSVGGFDHADIHLPSGRLYLAHTANDTLEVIDCVAAKHVDSIDGFKGIAGALVSEDYDRVFTSNRGENTVSIFAPGAEREAFKIAVGEKPNGLAFDASRGLLLAANVGDTTVAKSPTVSMVDIQRREKIAEIEVPGRTRWAVFDQAREMFYVNICSPSVIVAIDARRPTQIARSYNVSTVGPHGLELDSDRGLLFCACDAGLLVVLDIESGRVISEVRLGGAPDVIFLHPAAGRLYVAIGDPGVVEVIDVIDVHRMEREDVVPTEIGAHTLALDKRRNQLYAFLPQTHRSAVFAIE